MEIMEISSSLVRIENILGIIAILNGLQLILILKLTYDTACIKFKR